MTAEQTRKAALAASQEAQARAKRENASAAQSGPAFPLSDSCCEYGGTNRSDANGMTLRDYFAAKAMQSYLLDKDRDSFTFEQWANAAYEMADAMLQARE